jgi:hypothetical protein
MKHSHSECTPREAKAETESEANYNNREKE